MRKQEQGDSFLLVNGAWRAPFSLQSGGRYVETGRTIFLRLDPCQDGHYKL